MRSVVSAAGADSVSGPHRRVWHVKQAAIEQCQKIIGHEFADPQLLITALTHASVASTRAKSNERLEFLGDAVLGLVVCHELYDHADELLEGEMTRIKSAVVSRQTCAAVAEGLGIHGLMTLGKGMSTPAGLPMSISAAVFESIIGAIYLDGGLAPARRFILQHLGAHLDEALANEHQQNYKSLLQQYSQRKLGATPIYQLLDEKGPDHSKCFEVGVVIDGVHFPSAWGMSKKEAEQEAARQALMKLGVLEGLSEEEAPDSPRSAQGRL